MALFSTPSSFATGRRLGEKTEKAENPMAYMMRELQTWEPVPVGNPIGNPALCPTATEEIMALEEEVLRLINEARATSNNCRSMGDFKAVGPLQMNNELRCAARFHSKWMTENKYGHESPGGALGDDDTARAKNSGFQGFQAGENIIRGHFSARSAVDGWLSSDGHCANLMSPTFTLTGIGTWADDWTQMFGTL